MLAAGILGLICTGANGAPPAGSDTTPRPNVLLIVADDLGYSDLGVTGAEVETPRIDALAGEGVFFTNFHVAATCSPTRSMLLSGVDNHRNGLGSMREFMTAEQRGKPGYEGHLNDRVLTVAEILGEAGYDTAFAGKWHLGHAPGQRPHDRGFTRSLALLEGGGDNWSDGGAAPLVPVGTFTRNGERVPRPGTKFSSTLYADELIEFFEEQQPSGKPFFAVLSFQAVHWPHQAPQPYLDAVGDRYAAGWDATRAARLERLRATGLVPDDLPLPARHRWVRPWSELTAEEQATESRRMAAYAAMTENMDYETGRVLDLLRAQGRLDDTIVIFVSDNGPDPSEPDRMAAARDWYVQRYPNETLEGIGGPGSFPSYGPAWAQAGATHLREFKGSASEGGLRVPLIVAWPANVPGGRRSDAFGYATDIVPTILEAAGAQHPGTGSGDRALHPIDGRSLLPVMRGEAERVHPSDEPVGYQLMKNAALFVGDYKLVRDGPPSGDGEWRLYRLSGDVSESVDLAEAEPERFARMRALYDEYAREYGVIPMPDDYDVMKAVTEGTR